MKTNIKLTLLLIALAGSSLFVQRRFFVEGTMGAAIYEAAREGELNEYQVRKMLRVYPRYSDEIVSEFDAMEGSQFFEITIEEDVQSIIERGRLPIDGAQYVDTDSYHPDVPEINKPDYLKDLAEQDGEAYVRVGDYRDGILTQQQIQELRDYLISIGMEPNIEGEVDCSIGVEYLYVIDGTEVVMSGSSVRINIKDEESGLRVSGLEHNGAYTFLGNSRVNVNSKLIGSDPTLLPHELWSCGPEGDS